MRVTFRPAAAAAAVLAPAVAIGAMLLGPAAPSAAAGTAPAYACDAAWHMRWYTVRTEEEYLYQIASWVLGDGDRYTEIFRLNEGRRMPNGDRLTDPVYIVKGLQLILPCDARSGQGAVVQWGYLKGYGPPPAPKPAPKPVPKPVPKPAPKPVPKPAPKPVHKPAPKPVPKPVHKPTHKPTHKPLHNPAPVPPTAPPALH